MAKYICNPVDMNFPTEVDLSSKKPGLGWGMVPVPHRGAGDTTVILFKNRYYLNGSFDGFWYSDDLVTWEHVDGADLNVMRGAAADFCQVGDWVYQCASSREASSYYRTKDPMSKDFEFVKTSFGFWDPCLFQDDDGRLYLYWGCSNVDPIWGVEIDKETMDPIGERVVLLEGDPDHHGQERLGWNNDRAVGFLRPGETNAPGLDYTFPWIEGPYMNKHNGKYYLQYAAPATELPVYCDSYYVADSPLGPFTYAETSPFSLVKGGFYEGAGHGSSFEDKYGNWWHASTMIGAGGQAATRKMGIWPIGFDKDDIMYCNQNYADWPHIMPEGPIDPNATFPGWMLLSYNKPVKASTELPDHPAKYICDECSRTYFASSVRFPGEWVEMDLEKVMDVRAIQMNLTDHDLTSLMGIPYNHFSVLPAEEQKLYQRWLLEGSKDGENWEIICDKREAETNKTHDLLVFEEGIQVRYLRVTNYESPYFGNFAMLALRVFGHEDCAKPAAVKAVNVDRNAEDTCCVKFTWDAAEGATGYNVRWGIAEDKLYHSCLVFGKTELVMNNLNADIPYWVQIDAWNGGGITEGTALEKF